MVAEVETETEQTPWQDAEEDQAAVTLGAAGAPASLLSFWRPHS